MKIIVWNSQDKCVADYHKLIRGCDVLCLLDCGQWTVPVYALQIQNGLFHWKDEHEGLSYDIFSLVGIRLQDDFWLFANHESNRSNACHIGEFYLREISDRFRKAAFVADFKEKSYSWAQETIGGLYCIAPPKGYHPHTINYLFTIHVACTDFYLLEGYSRASNQPTFFKLEI